MLHTAPRRREIGTRRPTTQGLQPRCRVPAACEVAAHLAGYGTIAAAQLRLAHPAHSGVRAEPVIVG